MVACLQYGAREPESETPLARTSTPFEAKRLSRAMCIKDAG